MPRGHFWVFGYGSLMWHPGFKVERAVAARLYGYHRRLCLWSVHYRGSVNRPGLVLGLDRGGSCFGVALRVASTDRDAAADYLRAREMINNAYLPRVKKVYLQTGDAVEALVFLSRRDHPQFAKRMSVADTVAVVLGARGKSGDNREYVLNTVGRLNDLNIRTGALHSVAKQLRTRAIQT